MSAFRPTLRTGLAALLVGGALLSGVTPAHAATSVVPPTGAATTASADAKVICLTEAGTPGWHFTVSNGADSDQPVEFVVAVDGAKVFDEIVPIGGSISDDAAFPNSTLSAIQIYAFDEAVYNNNGSGDCSTPTPTPPTGTVTFISAEDGGYASYSFVTGEPGNTLFDVVLPDGTAEQWPFPSGTFGVNLAIPEDAPYDLSVSLNGAELSSTSGVASCLPDEPTTDPTPPTTDPSSDPTPPPTVLSSGDVAAASETPAAEAPQLPRTGTASIPLAGAGVSWLLVGSGFLALARRRRLQA